MPRVAGVLQGETEAGRGREMAPGGPRGLSASDAGRTPCAPVGPASPPQRAGVPAPGGVACWSPLDGLCAPRRVFRGNVRQPTLRPAACGRLLRPAPALCPVGRGLSPRSESPYEASVCRPGGRGWGGVRPASGRAPGEGVCTCCPVRPPACHVPALEGDGLDGPKEAQVLGVPLTCQPASTGGGEPQGAGVNFPRFLDISGVT